MFDRLVGGSVLAQSDRIVGPDVDGVDVHQRGQPHCRTHVIRELQERPTECPGRAVQHDARQDRAHRVLADAEVQHPAVPVGLEVRRRDRRRAERLHALDRRVVAARQIGRATPQFGQLRRDIVEHLTERGAGCDRLVTGLPRGHVGVPAFRQLLGEEPVEQLLAVGFALGPRVEAGLPLLVRLATPVDELAGVPDDLVGDLERLLRVETQDLLGGGHLVVAQRGAMHAAGVHLVRRRISDDGAQRDERRLVGHLLGLGDGLLDTDDILAALDLLHVPPVGAVPRGNILAQRDVGVVLDGDLVLVVEHDQIAQLLGAGQRRRLTGHAFFDVAVGGDHVDEVVERAFTGRCVGIEQAALVARRHRHADRRGQPLPQRAGGDLHTLGVPELGVAGCLRLERPQRLDVGEFQSESTQVELDVQRQAGVPAGQHEPVAAQPVHVAGVVAHLALEQRVGQRRQTHRRPGVTVAHLLDGIGSQHADGVHRAGVELGPVVGMVRSGQRRDLFERGHEAHSLDLVGRVDPHQPP